MSDMNDRLRMLGRRLDAAAPALSAAEVQGRARPPRLGRRWVWLPAAVAAAGVLAALAVWIVADDGDTSTLRTVPADGSTTSAPAAGTGSSTSTTSPASTTTPTSAPRPGPSTVAGERVDVFPYAGHRLAVVGVAAGDTLNVRAGPGTSYPILFTLGPLADDVVATGHNRLLGAGGIWSEIRRGDRLGWANTSFLLQPAGVDDVTTRLYPQPAERPMAPTMHDLARVVAARAVGDGSGDTAPRVVIAAGPEEGDLAEVTVDVVGVGDDAVGGLRLAVFAEPTPGGYRLRTVEQTTFCSRGVAGDLCV